VESVKRANGQEEIALHGGGRIRFFRPDNGSIRGTTLDLVLVDLATCDLTAFAEAHPALNRTDNADAHLVGYYC
jgi:hypothetical protein